MKILMVHNAYGKFSGEEAVVRDVKSVLIMNDHEVIGFERSSEELTDNRINFIKAFFTGIYNPVSRRKFRKILREENPDVVHIHNLYPFISPSILTEVKVASVPVIMTVHNYRLVCPNGLNYSKNKICERCSGGKEYWCALKNCEKNLFKSVGYGLRNWWARIQRYYLDNVSVFVCLTEFQRNKLMQAGYPNEKMVIIPNMVQLPIFKEVNSIGEYVGFAGRVSEEKGISILIKASKNCPTIPVRIAGGYDKMLGLEGIIPKNVKLLGHCNPDSLLNFYQKARFIVLPSVWYEGFPTVLVEAMLYGKAIICSNIGGLPDIVDDGVTGLLVKPGDDEDLAEKIQYLWERPKLCKEMGVAGREKALREYSQEQYYRRLMDVYKKAQMICSN